MPDARFLAPRALSLALLLGAVLPFAASLRNGVARELDILGTIDCSLASGQGCPPSDYLTLWTSSLSGTREPYIIDVSWIRPQLESAGQRQDDELCLRVEEVPNVGYRGLAVIERCQDVERSDNEDRDRRPRERNGNGSASPK